MGIIKFRVVNKEKLLLPHIDESALTCVEVLDKWHLKHIHVGSKYCVNNTIGKILEVGKIGYAIEVGDEAFIFQVEV